MTDTVVGVWLRVASVGDLEPDRGVAARISGGQVALFLVDDTVYAIDNRDPFSGANVMCRGIVGDRGGEPKVASPIFKQSFSLRSGRCLDEPSVCIPVYATRVRGDAVEIIPARSP